MSAQAIKILIVDDEASIREFLEIMLTREGYDVLSTHSAKDALKLLSQNDFSVVITDISMPEINGIELLTKIKQQQYSASVILMTAFGSTERAVEAMKLGASDYITKPFKIDDMKMAIQTAIRNSQQIKKSRAQNSAENFNIDSIIGNSPQVIEIFNLIKKIAPTKTNVMILGESGTGKELVAHAIHNSNPDRKARFVAINCAAVPETLFESELFGHKKGSFTGAIQDKDGIFKQADGGTLFLDEVGDIPLNVQVKMLRAIQQKSFRPIGGNEDIQVNVRLICATNKNLEQMCHEGKFREDLYYRLNVIQIKLPPLRERRDDIPQLANHFLTKFNLAMGKSVQNISADTMKYLMQYEYPGNIRELENIIERAVALETDSAISVENLPQKVILYSSQLNSTTTINSEKQPPAEDTGSFDLEKNLADFEKQHILHALNQAGGVKKKAAQMLGISFRSLRYRIEKYGISDPNPEENE